MYSLLTSPQQALDGAWHERFQTIATEPAEIYFSLEPSPIYLKEARQIFVNSGCTQNPNLRPQTLDNVLYEQRAKELLLLKADVTADEQNDSVRQAYVGRIDELLLQIRILQSGFSGNAEDFTEANHATYGSPDPTIFAATCAWYRNLAQEQFEHPDAAVRQTAEKVLQLIPDAQGDATQIVPTADTFAAVKTMHFQSGGYLPHLLAGALIPERVNEQTGKPILETVLQNIGCNYDIGESPNGGWGVSHANRVVTCPRTYSRSRDEFTGLLTHEIGSHLLEHVNGLRGPLQLLSSGLDRYEASNEGRANLREQIIFDSPADFLKQNAWRHITTMHLAISLASGLHGQAYDFVHVYETLYPINLLWQQLHDLSGCDAEATAHEKTWNTLTRVLKGTDGTGGAYLKDMVYLEGNVHCWQLAKTHPEMILWGDHGKFDITRADHVRLLQDLGVLPSADGNAP